jgi:hypothetical protein
VQRRLVARAEDWAWSSARWYAWQRPALLDMDPALPRLYEVQDEAGGTGWEDRTRASPNPAAGPRHGF